MIRYRKTQKKQKNDINKYRLFSLYGGVGLVALLIIWRLFMLQVINHKTYVALASGQYEIFQQLFPVRGSIYIQNDNSDTLGGLNNDLYPLATNKLVYEVYAQPKYIENPHEVAKSLYTLLSIVSEDEQSKILKKLQKEDDPYEPIAKKVEQSVIDQLKELDLTGIGFKQQLFRYYPEHELASNILGFVRHNENNYIGQYGLEGYFDEELSGKQGYLRSERDAFGRWIAVSDRQFEQAEDGVDLVLTINKSIQYRACEKLKESLTTYEAESASLVIMNPQTGAIIAMCNYPTFNPNEYGQVGDINYFNNKGIYDSYEPGSIFKPVTVAAALDQKKVSPTTVYHDTGHIPYNNKGEVDYNEALIVHRLKNYKNKVHGDVTVTKILEDSVNTGTIFTMQQVGTKIFKEYVRDFGFGEFTDINLDTESKGNLKSLERKAEVFSATASFGQGITVTPLQMVQSYSAFANGGKLVKPYIVQQKIYADGSIINTKPEFIRQPITARTASLMTGILISVVDNGHAAGARVPGYYIAGKTGTAQVAERGVYGSDTIHSFVGYGPTDDARFVMIIRIDKPQKGASSASTAANVFGEIARFMVDYYKIPPERNME